MTTPSNAALRCAHGYLLSCHECHRRLVLSLLQEILEAVEAADNPWPDANEITIQLERAAALLKEKPLTLKADSVIDDSEIMRRLLG